MSGRDDRRRERDRFADDTGRWTPWVALAGALAFLLVPLTHLIEWAMRLCGVL